MNGKGFQALIAHLGDLSNVQREALITALKRRLSLDDAIELIDRQFKAAPCCGHCGSKSVGGWSSQSGLARYRCKDCSKTFNALTGTPLAQLHRRDAWFDYAKAIADGLSLRKAAARCGIALDTSFRWRHRFLKAAKDVKAKAVRGIVEADETFIRASAKGSKKLVGRAPRNRGTKPKPGLSSDDYDAVLIVRDRHGATTDHVLPDLEGATFARLLKPVVANDALLVSDGRAAYGQFADEAGLLHISLNASKGERVYGSYHIQNVNAYISRLKEWMRRFKGVASRHLESYLGWWRMIDRDGQDFSATRCLMQALN
jgi:transposase-like protein